MERLTEHKFNGLDNSQEEQLTLLAEECAEVIQAITKIKRHGFESCHPGVHMNNRAHLEKELGHVLLAAILLFLSDEIEPEGVFDSLDSKAREIQRWLHHNDDASRMVREYMSEIYQRFDEVDQAKTVEEFSKTD